MSETLDQIDQFRRGKLQGLLDQCTPEQQALFRRMYHTTDAKEVSDVKIDWAIQQCEATIRNNANQDTPGKSQADG